MWCGSRDGFTQPGWRRTCLHAPTSVSAPQAFSPRSTKIGTCPRTTGLRRAARPTTRGHAPAPTGAQGGGEPSRVRGDRPVADRGDLTDRDTGARFEERLQVSDVVGLHHEVGGVLREGE